MIPQMRPYDDATQMRYGMRPTRPTPPVLLWRPTRGIRELMDIGQLLSVVGLFLPQRSERCLGGAKRMGGTLAGRDVGCPIGTIVAVDPNGCSQVFFVYLEGGWYRLCC